MRIKAKSCGCLACRMIRRKNRKGTKVIKRQLQKSFRQDVKRCVRIAKNNYGEEYPEPNTAKLSYFWA